MASWWQDILGTGLAGGAAATAGATAGTLAAVWTNLRDYKMWRSLGWLLLGIALMFLGITWWLAPAAARDIAGVRRLA